MDLEKKAGGRVVIYDRGVRKGLVASMMLPVGLLLTSCGANALGSSAGGDGTGETASVATATVLEQAATTASVETPTTTLGPAIPISTRTLEEGHKGDDVLLLQKRLTELKYDVGVADGYFGLRTRQAIWSYQRKILGLRGGDVSGQVTPALYTRIFEPLGLADPRPEATARHAVIDLPAQTMTVWENGAIRLMTHTSHGTGEEWCEEPKNVPAWPGATTTTLPKGQRMQRICGQSVTPGGTFKVYRKERELARDPTWARAQPDLLQLGYCDPRPAGRAEESGLARLRASPDAHQRVHARAAQSR